MKLPRYDEAIVHYDRTIELQPDFSEAFNDRGISRFRIMR